MSAAGLFFIVLGLLQSRTYGFGASRADFKIGDTVVLPKGSLSVVWIAVAIGALFLAWFVLHVRAREHKGRDVLLSLRLFKNKVSNLSLGTQLIQWLILQGSVFTLSVYLQEVDGYSAVKTGLQLTPATIGILLTSALADRFARRHPQRLAGHRRVHDRDRRVPAAVRPGPGALGDLDLDSWPAVARSGHRHHADVLGEPGAVQLP